MNTISVASGTETAANVLQGVLHLLPTLPMDWAFTEHRGLPTTLEIACDAHCPTPGQVAFTTVHLLGIHYLASTKASLMGKLIGNTIKDNDLLWVVKALLLKAGCDLVNTAPSSTYEHIRPCETSAHAHLCALQSVLPALQSLGWVPGTPLQSCAKAAKAFVKASPSNHTFRW